MSAMVVSCPVECLSIICYMILKLVLITVFLLFYFKGIRLAKISMFMHIVSNMACNISDHYVTQISLLYFKV